MRPKTAHFGRYDQFSDFAYTEAGEQCKAGADPEVEEGGAHIECFWCAHAARSARGFLFSARIMHSVVGGCGGMLPQENF